MLSPPKKKLCQEKRFIHPPGRLTQDFLQAPSDGYTYTYAYAVNDAGTAVGHADKYVNGSYKGVCAVRWDASGTAATELCSLGNSGIYAYATACAVNNVGTAVGNSDDRAVIWLPNASAIDLNNLGVASIPDGGTWTLTTAKALSTDGWVAGEGYFDPDGSGPLTSYTRLWVAQVGLGGTWTNATGGTWGRGPNWSTGTPAMQVGDATFDVDAIYTVALDRDELTKTIAVDAGTVIIDYNGHTLATEGGLSIADGATLKGAGTIVSDITNAGTIAPGNSPGTLNLTGDLVNTGTLEFEIAGDLIYDQINLTGVFNAGGVITITLDDYSPASGCTFDLMDFASFVNNGYTFDVSHAALSAGLVWDTAAFATTGSIGVVNVPEPSSITLLLCCAIAGLIWRRRGSTRL